MSSASGRQIEQFLIGHGDVSLGPSGGVVPHRISAAARQQVDDPFFRWVERNSTGVRLRVRTDAPEVRLRLRATAVPEPGRAVALPQVVVRTAGDQVETVPEPDLVSQEWDTLAACGHETVVAGRASSGGVEFLLPHNAAVELLELDADGNMAPWPDERPKWVHYGSSISHCAGAPTPLRTWPQLVADAWDVNLRHLGLGGNAQLDQCVARVIRDAPADLITLAIGINLVNADSMRARTFRPALHGFLDTIREGAPDTPIAVSTAIYCPIHETTPGPVINAGTVFRTAQRSVESDDDALTLQVTRRIVTDVVRERMAHDAHLALVDGLEFFGPADAGHLPDLLHPDDVGNSLIATRILQRWPHFSAAALG